MRYTKGNTKMPKFNRCFLPLDSCFFSFRFTSCCYVIKMQLFDESVQCIKFRYKQNFGGEYLIDMYCVNVSQNTDHE